MSSIIVVKLLFSLFFNLVVFARGWLVPLAAATWYFVQPGLIAYAVQIPVILYLIHRRIAWKAVGLDACYLRCGTTVTLGIWILLQLIGVVFFGPGIDQSLLSRGWTRLAGVQLANLLNVFLEEVLFRGFLFMQLYWSLPWKRMRLPAALLVSQAIFALMHVPHRVAVGVSAGNIVMEQGMLLGIGVLYALIYLRTKNIFIAMGIHLLANLPIALFMPQGLATQIVYVIGVLVLAGTSLRAKVSAERCQSTVKRTLS